jgi:hypothetical protein
MVSRAPDTEPGDPDALAIRLPNGAGWEEASTGRWWGLFNADSEDEPLVLFPDRTEAQHYLERRQAADPEGDDYLGRDWTVLRVDAVLSTLNSTDPDPFPELEWPPRFTIQEARRTNPQRVAEHLVRRAFEERSEDNITAIVVRVELDAGGAP